MIRRLLLVAVIHLLFFICFPRTGPLGPVYGWASWLLWSCFIILARAPLEVLASGFAGKTLLAACVAFTLAATMPQTDKLSPLAKLRAKKFPAVSDMKEGLGNFGIKRPKDLEGIISRQLEAGKAVWQRLF